MTFEQIVGALILAAPLVWLLVVMWGRPDYQLTWDRDYW